MQGYRTIHLQLQGFSDAEFQKLDSILALAEARMDYLWALGNSADADVILVPDISLRPDGDPRPCIYYKKSNENTADHIDQGVDVWSLTVDEHQVPHLWQLTKVFNAVADSICQASETVAVDKTIEDAPSVFSEISEDVELIVEKAVEPEKTVAQIASTDTGQAANNTAPKPSDPLLLELLQPRADAGTDAVFRVCFESGDCFSADLDRDLYFSPQPIETMAACFAQCGAFEVRAVSPHTLDIEADEIEGGGQPLSHLRWYIALMSPSSDLRDQLADKTVKLKRWPDLGLPGCTPLIRLAAFMQSNEASVMTVAEKTETPVDKVCAFLNACAQENLVIYGDQEAIHEKPVAADFKSLLSRISDRINAE